MIPFSAAVEASVGELKDRFVAVARRKGVTLPLDVIYQAGIMCEAVFDDDLSANLDTVLALAISTVQTRNYGMPVSGDHHTLSEIKKQHERLKKEVMAMPRRRALAGLDPDEPEQWGPACQKRYRHFQQLLERIEDELLKLIVEWGKVEPAYRQGLSDTEVMLKFIERLDSENPSQFVEQLATTLEEQKARLQAFDGNLSRFERYIDAVEEICHVARETGVSAENLGDRLCSLCNLRMSAATAGSSFEMVTEVTAEVVAEVVDEQADSRIRHSGGVKLTKEQILGLLDRPQTRFEAYMSGRIIGQDRLREALARSFTREPDVPSGPRILLVVGGSAGVADDIESVVRELMSPVRKGHLRPTDDSWEYNTAHLAANPRVVFPFSIPLGETVDELGAVALLELQEKVLGLAAASERWDANGNTVDFWDVVFLVHADDTDLAASLDARTLGARLGGLDEVQEFVRRKLLHRWSSLLNLEFVQTAEILPVFRYTKEEKVRLVKRRVGELPTFDRDNFGGLAIEVRPEVLSALAERVETGSRAEIERVIEHWIIDPTMDLTRDLPDGQLVTVALCEGGKITVRLGD